MGIPEKFVSTVRKCVNMWELQREGRPRATSEGGGCRRWMQEVDARGGCRGWMHGMDAGGGIEGVGAGGGCRRNAPKRLYYLREPVAGNSPPRHPEAF